MHKEFYLFSREQCDTKIDELLEMLGLMDRKMITGDETIGKTIEYDKVEEILATRRESSKTYLRKALKITEE